MATSHGIPDFTFRWLNESQTRLSVRYTGEVPAVVGPDGESVADAGLVAWPSDSEISAAVGVEVSFLDKGDDLLEAIFASAASAAAATLGRAKTPAKAAAARANGAKGGRPAGLYVARVIGGNACPSYATAVIAGGAVTICGAGRVDGSGGVVCYQSGPHAGKPVLFRGIRAAKQAACACHWSNQRYTYDVARGANRAEGVELVGASEDTAWRSCQEV